MPKVPTFINKVNFITRFLSVKCEYPWIVYFESALPALGNAILMAVSFGIGDVARGFARPEGLRAERHGRKGSKSEPTGRKRGRPTRFGGPNRERALIPELGEMIGSKIPGAKTIKEWGQNVPGKVFIATVDAGLQEGLYYWLILDIIFEDLYESMLGLVTDPRTYCPAGGRVYIDDPFWAGGGAFVPLQFNTTRYQHDPCKRSGSGLRQDIAAAGICGLSLSGSVHVPAGFTGVIEVNLSVGPYVVANQEIRDLHEGDSFEITLSYTTNGSQPTTVTPFIRNTGISGFENLEGSFWMVDASYYKPQEFGGAA